VGQAPKHAHSIKAAQCCILEIIGLVLLAQLEGQWLELHAQEHFNHLATSAVVQTSASKAVSSLANSRPKHAPNKPIAGAKVAFKGVKLPVVGAAAPMAEAAAGSDSEDDFLAAQHDIYLKMQPRDMHTLAQSVASPNLTTATSSPHAEEWQTTTKPKSTNASSFAASVPTVSGWNLPATTMVSPLAAPTDVLLHSGLSLPTSEGLSDGPFVPLSTAFTSSATPQSVLPGAFRAAPNNVSTGNVFDDANSFMFGGGMGATSASSLALNAALFAEAEGAKASSEAHLIAQAAQWAVDDS
jgi:hypothetical protein